MATNPRIEDLRKRIERDPGSRLFAQLAEELRKDGELEEAIRVARDGLQRHPKYPSARMTLGRALLDTGDWAAARTEFELVLKAAADNILASRYLGECLENLGERDAAIARYRTTLGMAPGEKHVVARLQELEKGAATPGAAPATSGAAAPAAPAARPTTGLRPATAPPAPIVPPPAPPPAPMAPFAAPPPPVAAAPTPVAPPAPPAPTVPAAPLPPIPLSSVHGEMELETSHSPREVSTAPPKPAGQPPLAPIPLVAADEEFELEQPYESRTTSIGTPTAAVTPAPAPAAVAAPAPESAEDQEFELEAPHEAPATAWAATIRPLPVEEPPPPASAPTPAAERTPVPEPTPAPRPPLVPSGTASSLISPTLGELYFNQGFTDKAIEVYRELSIREPGNERLSARLTELEKLQRSLAGGEAPAPAPERTAAAPPAPDAAAERREAIERTITRLEGLLAAIRKG